MTGGVRNCADIYAVKVLDMASVTRRGAQRFFGTSGGSSGQEITCSRSNYTGSYPRTVRTQRYETTYTLFLVAGIKKVLH